jgi:hypothetical protein
VVEIAQQLVEAVHSGQVGVAIPQVVLAELSGRISQRLQKVSDGRRPVGNALGRARHANGQQARAEGMLAQDERRAAGRAALLGVGVREQRAFSRDPVDVRRPVAHDRVGVSADVVDADVIPPDDEDVGSRLLRVGDACPQPAQGRHQHCRERARR